MNGKMIIIEGGIGAGKSTLAKTMLAQPEHFFGTGAIVTLGREVINAAFLGLFLRNKKELAFPFQTYIARERLEMMRRGMDRVKAGDVVVLDRGIAGDIAFALSNGFTEEQLSVYFSLIADGAPDLVPASLLGGASPPTAPAFVRSTPLQEEEGDLGCEIVVLHLKCSPSVALGRMRARGNASEVDSYDLAYFEEIAQNHDRVMSLLDEMPNVRVVEVDYDTLPPLDDDGMVLFDPDILKQ